MEEHHQPNDSWSLREAGELHDSSSRNADRISEQAIREELTVVVRSKAFVNSDRLSRFLRFTIEAVLAGDAHTLKEYTIGVEVYDRRPPYHPAQDSIVRTEARRLRKKIKDYYENEGKHDPVFIYFRPGTYVPVFRASEIVGDLPVPEPEILARPATDSGIAIAVLPFVDVSMSALESACAKGLTNELTHLLTRIRGFRVAADRLASPLESQHLSIPTLAQALGVQLVVAGTVRVEGNWLRVTVQLVNADGFQVWSQRFEAQLDPQNLFPILASIVSGLISRVHFSHAGIWQRQVLEDASQLTVYRDVLTAEALLDERTPSSLEEALAKFKNVVRIAPQYAPAHVGITRCYTAIALSGVPGSAVAVSCGKEVIRRALELEPEMSLAHSCLGCLLALEWNWQEAELSFKRAISLGTNTFSARQFVLFLCARQRFDEAWVYLQKSQQQDPFLHRQKIAYSQFLYLSRDFEKVGQYFAEAAAYGSQPLESRLYLALSQIKLGHIGSANDLAQTLRREAGAQPALMSRIAEVLALCGEKDSALRIVSSSNLLSSQSPVSRFRQARLSVALGDDEAALSLLARAVEERETELVWLAADPGFDGVRESSAFRRILSRVMPEQT